MAQAAGFDTHAFVKRLVATGVPEAQAEVHAELLVSLVHEELATKRDIKELELATKRDIKELELATRRDLKELELATKRGLTELEQATGRDLKALELATKRDLKELELRLRHDLTLRLGAVAASSIAIVAILVKLL